jgi:transmembrane sensor
MWRASHPAHRTAYQEAEKLWRDLGRVRANADLLHNFPSRLRSAALRRSSWTQWTIAASVVLVIGMFLAEQHLQWIGAAMADYRTGMGEQRIVTLEDGSAIHLNTNTAVNVVFSESRRELHLLRGEASFTVARDPVRPFVVKSADVLTRALGTIFMIRRRSDASTVTVLEHEVQLGVSSGNMLLDITLHEGEQVRYSGEEGFSPVRRIDLGKETAWQRGKVIFDAQPLAEVVEELNRHRHGQIVILNPALRALKVTGLVEVAEPEAALRMIQQTIPIRRTSLSSYLVLLH